MAYMRSAIATRRQFLTAGGAALAGAVLTSTAASAVLRFPSGSPTSTPPISPSPSGGGQGGGSPTPTASATPAPTPATVTIAVPVYQPSMLLDCETAARDPGPLLICRTFRDPEWSLPHPGPG